MNTNTSIYFIYFIYKHTLCYKAIAFVHQINLYSDSVQVNITINTELRRKVGYRSQAIHPAKTKFR